MPRSEIGSHKNSRMKKTLTISTETQSIQAYIQYMRPKRCCCLLCPHFEFAWSNWQKWEHNFEGAEQRKPLLLATIWRKQFLFPRNISHSRVLSLLALQTHSAFINLSLQTLKSRLAFTFADRQIPNMSRNVNYKIDIIYPCQCIWAAVICSSDSPPYQYISFLSGEAPALHYQTVSTSWGQCWV